MFNQFSVIFRVGVLILCGAIAACTGVDQPRLGAGPPVLSPKVLGTFSEPFPNSADVIFALDPVTNAPGDMIYAFEDTLKARAPTRQFKIVDPDDTTANYRLKGYLSAVGDYSGTLVIYVVDVFDLSGTRIHRVSGQFNAAGSLADPWANISNANIAVRAAQETIDELGNWIRGYRL